MQFILIFLQQQNEFLFRSDKVFTVLSVMLIIWGAVLIQLFLMNKKVSRLEREVNAKKQ